MIESFFSGMLTALLGEAVEPHSKRWWEDWRERERLKRRREKRYAKKLQRKARRSLR